MAIFDNRMILGKGFGERAMAVCTDGCVFRISGIDSFEIRMAIDKQDHRKEKSKKPGILLHHLLCFMGVFKELRGI